MWKLVVLFSAAFCCVAVTSVPVNGNPNASPKYFNEYIKWLPGRRVASDFVSALPHTYVAASDIPANFNWGNINGSNYLTKSLNQHIPQYCGSCWAHGALSALADRIKIARKGQGLDINLAIQYILNCGAEMAGSCHGGSHSGVYEMIKSTGFVPYDTCLQYATCSAESSEGNCKGTDYKCSAINTCRTCSTFSDMGGFCAEVDVFPNASIAEFGEVSGADKMAAEIYARGPIACGVNAVPLLEYKGGIFNDASAGTDIDHIVSVVGFGTDSTGLKYWIVRNSWGEYWGEMGYFRVARGNNMLGLEADCAWATPKTWTERNFPCYEDGSNCGKPKGEYTDASVARPWHLL